jgi:hypothetical protein
VKRTVQQTPRPVQSDDEPFIPPASDADAAWWAALSAATGTFPDEAPEDLYAPDGVAEEVGTPAEVLLAEASYYESRDTAAGRFLAAEIRQLATLAECLHAETFDQLAGRREVEEEHYRREVYDRGRADGWEAAKARLKAQGSID